MSESAMERRLTADATALGRSRDALQRSYEELAAVHRDLEKKTGDLNRLNRELVDLDARRAQLLSDVSHELQTPLVAIRGYTQMILEGRLGRINDEQRRGLEVALRNVDRMVELIANLLALGRSESSQPLQAEPISAERVIETVIERHEAQARRSGIEIVQRNEAPGSLVLAERDAFQQVIDNLVANAIKFNRQMGRATISLLNGPQGFVTVEVSDTGVGIAADDLERIFDRFYRGKTAAGIPGSGIGLATVRNIVQRHGGTIEVQSEPGQGSVFRVRWPRALVASSAR